LFFGDIYYVRLLFSNILSLAMKRWILLSALGCVLAVLGLPQFDGGGTLQIATIAEAQDRKLPYWASIREVPARMRKGPSTDVPVLWEYRRKDLPVKVVAIYQNWRKISDPDGAEGWMNVRLLSPQRTAIVRESIRPLREAPNGSARILWRAEAGVVGRLSDCADGWCVLDVKGQRGYIQIDHIWGA
jgi:SH3-like domain-containing protein